MPISAVERTCVPPHSSREQRPVADLDHAHDVAVLLAEQRHRAERPGLVERRGERPHRQVLEDPRVDLVLDVPALLVTEPGAVGEVEAQLVGTHVGAGLANVIAEPRSQRRVQEVRGGVVGLRRVARDAVHSCDDALTGLRRTAHDLHDERLVVTRAHDLADAQLAVAALAGDHARIAHLPAALGVERRLGELHQHVRPFSSETPWTTVFTSSSS